MIPIYAYFETFEVLENAFGIVEGWKVTFQLCCTLAEGKMGGLSKLLCALHRKLSSATLRSSKSCEENIIRVCLLSVCLQWPQK